MQETPDSQVQENPEMSSEEQTRKKFEERYRFFMNGLSDACENAKVQVAVAVVMDPEMPDSAIVFSMGDEYQQAKVLAKMLRKLNKIICKNVSA